MAELHGHYCIGCHKNFRCNDPHINDDGFMCLCLECENEEKEFEERERSD